MPENPPKTNIATIEEAQKKAALTAQQAPFVYGWCYTDHKDGKKNYRSRNNYVQDEPFASSLKSMMAKLGLPEPDASQYFKGTSHDLLFVESHGVVLKIGPTDIEDLIHPAILQPLGWMEDKENKLTVAIYPGIELLKHFSGDRSAMADVESALRRTGQGAQDMHENNLGIIRLKGNKPVQMALDVDNQYNGTTDPKRKNNKKEALSDESSLSSSNRSHALSHTINKTYTPEDDLKNWMQAFEFHQGLRDAYWKAFGTDEKGNDTINPAAMQRFWEKCADATHSPRSVVAHGWSQRINENGVLVWVKHDTVVDVMALYTPWTGKQEDRRPKFAKGGELAKRQAAIEAVAENPALLDSQPERYKRSFDFINGAIALNDAVIDHIISRPINNRELALNLYKTAQKKDNAENRYSFRTLHAVSAELKNSPDFWESVSDIGIDGDIIKLIPKSIENYEDTILKIVSKDPFILPDVPRSIAGTAFFLKLLQKRPTSFSHFPQKQQEDPRIYEAVLQKNPTLFMLLPKHLRNRQDIFNRVVADYPGAIRYAGEDILNNRENIETAIELDPDIYPFLPEKIRDERDLLIFYLKTTKHIRFDFADIPADLRNDIEVCTFYAKSNRARDMLEQAGDSIKNNKDIVKICIQTDALNFKYAGTEARADRELALMAIKRSYIFYEDIPEPLASQEDFLREAMNIKPSVIKCIPETAFQKNKTLILDMLQERKIIFEDLPPFVLKDKSFMDDVLKDAPEWAERYKEEIEAQRDARDPAELRNRLYAKGRLFDRIPSPAELQHLKEDIIKLILDLHPVPSRPRAVDVLNERERIRHEPVRFNPRRGFNAVAGEVGKAAQAEILAHFFGKIAGNVADKAIADIGIKPESLDKKFLAKDWENGGLKIKKIVPQKETEQGQAKDTGPHNDPC